MVRGLLARTDVAAAGSGSFLNTARQPGLSWDLFWIMQTVTASTFGIAELQRRNASPVQACSCSGVWASPAAGHIATKSAVASIKLSWTLLDRTNMNPPEAF